MEKRLLSLLFILVTPVMAGMLGMTGVTAAVVTFDSINQDFRVGIDYFGDQMDYGLSWNFVLSSNTGNPSSALVEYPALPPSPLPGAAPGSAFLDTFLRMGNLSPSTDTTLPH